MGLLALTSLLVAGTGAFLISRILPNLSPGQKRLQRDIKLLRERTAPLREKIIPLKGSELELLSDQKVDYKQSRGFKKITQGIYTTIYAEPVLAFAYRKYLSGPDGLILGYTHHQEIIFWIRSKGSRLVVNEEFLGVLDPDGRLLDRPKGKKVLATISPKGDGMDVITVGEREIATLAKPRNDPKSNLQHRVFELVVNDLNELEKRILWSLTLYDLIRDSED